MTLNLILIIALAHAGLIAFLAVLVKGALFADLPRRIAGDGLLLGRHHSWDSDER